MNKKEIVPEQKKGFKVEHIKSETAESKNAARDLYRKAKERLLDINNWDKLSGAMPSYFGLCDNKGNIKNGKSLLGDYVRIGLPGPSSSEGKGFDWVKVEKLGCEENDNENNIFMTLRPSANPYGKSDEIAHFFSKESTSNFIIEQTNNIVVASYYGRNEFPNIKDAHKLLDKIRHVVVALGGLLGMSKIQWTILIDNIMSKNDKK
ncbi:MAG: hypothetical protein M3R36_10980 [Bacteroidota bacterium]|nr:hypothetical protein [Bacteroidota bacterium]